MSEPTVACYKCRGEVAPRVIAPAHPEFGFGNYETRDYWCDRCGPLAYWTVDLDRAAALSPEEIEALRWARRAVVAGAMLLADRIDPNEAERALAVLDRLTGGAK